MPEHKLKLVWFLSVTSSRGRLAHSDGFPHCGSHCSPGQKAIKVTKNRRGGGTLRNLSLKMWQMSHKCTNIKIFAISSWHTFDCSIFIQQFVYTWKRAIKNVTPRWGWQHFYFNLTFASVLVFHSFKIIFQKYEWMTVFWNFDYKIIFTYLHPQGKNLPSYTALRAMSKCSNQCSIAGRTNVLP